MRRNLRAGGWTIIDGASSIRCFIDSVSPGDCVRAASPAGAKFVRDGFFLSSTAVAKQARVVAKIAVLPGLEIVLAADHTAEPLVRQHSRAATAAAVSMSGGLNETTIGTVVRWSDKRVLL